MQIPVAAMNSNAYVYSRLFGFNSNRRHYNPPACDHVGVYSVGR